MSEQLKPELRFPEFDESWKLLRLGNITSKIGSGKTPRGGESNYQRTGIPFIRSQNVQNGSLELDDTHIPLEIHDEMSNSKTQPFDILLNITGASIGRCCIVPEHLKEANVNQHVSIIRLENGEPLFYQNFIISHSGQKLIYQQQTTGGKEGLNFKSIKNFKVPSPSVDEQQKIANFLKAIDKRIKLLKAKKDALEDYKTSIMQKLFSQEIRFKQEDGSDFPEWEEKELGEIGNFKTSSVNKKIEEDEQIVYLVNYMNVYNHEEITNANRYLLMQVSAKESQIEGNSLGKGDILFTPSSETPTDIGHSVVIKENLDNTLYSYHLLRFRPNIPLDIGFSHYFCNDKNVLKQISRFAAGSTRFTISLQSFAKVKVNIPAIEEQQKIATFLSLIDKRLEKIENLANDLKCFKQSLLQKMFL